jgi:hypothetical protein
MTKFLLINNLIKLLENKKINIIKYIEIENQTYPLNLNSYVLYEDFKSTNIDVIKLINPLKFDALLFEIVRDSWINGLIKYKDLIDLYNKNKTDKFIRPELQYRK